MSTDALKHAFDPASIAIIGAPVPTMVMGDDPRRRTASLTEQIDAGETVAPATSNDWT